MRRPSPVFLCALAALAAALFLAGCAREGADQPPRAYQVGDKVDPFTLTGLDGGEWSLLSRRGKVVVLNFWATWCGSCKEEMPSLNEFVKKTAGDIEVVSVLYRDDAEEARRYLKKNGFSIPVYLDPGLKAAERFGLTGVPETYVIDKKGVLRNRVIGPMDFENPADIEYIKGIAAE